MKRDPRCETLFLLTQGNVSGQKISQNKKIPRPYRCPSTIEPSTPPCTTFNVSESCKVPYNCDDRLLLARGQGNYFESIYLVYELWRRPVTKRLTLVKCVVRAQPQMASPQPSKSFAHRVWRSSNRYFSRFPTKLPFGLVLTTRNTKHGPWPFAKGQWRTMQHRSSIVIGPPLSA
ncbi:hypothetical protein BDY19DRAFT_315346 [Irpex rosettiformis]|uniref:Uncharacterized protein n=1 Tax=Irpex rosettiformis TaxID=378272 RepID=A0ACB8TXX8_9APHY|nr:hypothetical protein BDY19DRAFT_315346 [Irpex rosettiformis]